MKKIRDFEEKDRLTLPLLVKDVRNGTTNKGAAYVSVIVQDNSGTIDGKYWDIRPDQAALIVPGRIVSFTFEVLLYNKALQLRIVKVAEVDERQLDMSEYVVAASASETERKNMVRQYVASIANPVLRQLVEGMFEKVGQLYYEYPAASRIHHSYLGGLSEHSLAMARMADFVAAQYPDIDRDLLVAGALVHDMGKTAEMSGPVTTEYTLAGRLEGHISLANGWLSEVAEKLGLENKQETVLLHHMILSHHGHYEFGSPVLPMLMEAEALSMIDNLDAKMNALKQALDQTREGEWTSKMFSMENRQFYKPKKGD